MNSVLILTAIELEARTLARELELPRLGAFSFPAFGRGRLRLAPVGLRAVLCAPRWAHLVEGLDHPLVVSAGVCGALDPRLSPGDLVIPERVMEVSGDSHPIAPGHHRAALARSGTTAWTGALITTREVVRTPDAKAADMESAVILARAGASGCPALVVRGVSDGAGQSLAPELTGLVSREGRLHLGRTLALTLTRPATLPEALGLRRRVHRALGAVARVLATLIG